MSGFACSGAAGRVGMAEAAAAAASAAHRDEPSPPPWFYQSIGKQKSNLLAEDTQGTQAHAGTQGESIGAPGLTRALPRLCRGLP